MPIIDYMSATYLSIFSHYIRALHTRDWKRAKHFQDVYSRLKQVQAADGFSYRAEYKELLDHISELGHTSVKERIDELREQQKHGPTLQRQECELLNVT